ncbi:MAG: hypothetical protein JWP29_331 [Rhodoferax sp.]|nr:hypothetical protein [Rhodoferax sp.]
MQVNVNVAGGSAEPASARAESSGDELKHKVLIQVAQALHQAMVHEYCERFHLFAARQAKEVSRSKAYDLAELAARFQIELTEAPHASRLQEFWRQAGVLRRGLLFDGTTSRQEHQGLAELVALVGVSHVHQRISGKLSEKEAQLSGASRHTESTQTPDTKWAELAKPLSAVVAGAAVATAGASQGDAATSLLWGALASLGSLFVFRLSTVTKTQRERRVDRTFVPDLSIKTLHRVMPELFDRLFAAGLAPVFIVDELDKVDNLDDRIYPLIHGLKKLFAERSLTCLLVDRGFFERLHLREEKEKQPGPRPALP